MLATLAVQSPHPSLAPWPVLAPQGTKAPLALRSPLPMLVSENAASPPSPFGLQHPLGDTTPLPTPNTCQEPPAGFVAILPPEEMITWDSYPESPYPSDPAPINVQAIQLYSTWNQGPGPPFFTAYSVFHEQGQTAVYKDIDYTIVRELQRPEQESDVSCERVIAYLESISAAYVLRPADWKNIMKMVLTMTQYMVWFSDYREFCMAQAGHLQRRDPPVLVQLFSEGVYAHARSQTGLISHTSIAAL